MIAGFVTAVIWATVWLGENDLCQAWLGDGHFPYEAFDIPHVPLSSALECRHDRACGHWLPYDP